MGLFTDKCINQACDQRVRKGAKFCPKCGSAGPKGLAKCGQCGAEVRTSASFCRNCGANLASVVKAQVFDNRWARRPEDFAAAVEASDLSGWMTKPLFVEHGTRAILFQKGKFMGELTEGSHNLGGFLKTLNHFMFEQGLGVVLVDAGDCTIDLENGGMWTADHFEVGTTERLVLRIGNPDSMYVNLIKGRNKVALDELEQQLAGEVQMLLTGIVANQPADALFADMSIRNQIEARLREAISVTLGRLGLELVQLRFISFVGEAYEKLRQQKGEVAVRAGEVALDEERNKLAIRLRESLTQDKMDAFKSEQDFAQFVHQTEHEIGLKDVIRTDELARLTERFKFERDREGLLRRIEVAGIADAEAREKAWKDLLATEKLRDETQRGQLERDLTNAKSVAERRKVEIELERIEHAEDMRQAEEGLTLLSKQRLADHEDAVRKQELEAKRLADRSKATAQALLTITEGPAAERIMKLEELRTRQNMTADQILALAAQASPDAAKALATKYSAEGQLSAEKARLLEKQLADQRQMADSFADRMERVMQTALGQMGDVAAARAGSARSTVVVPASHGGPVVVGSAGLTGPTCKQCGAPLETGAEFCSECGKKQ